MMKKKDTLKNLLSPKEEKLESSPNEASTNINITTIEEIFGRENFQSKEYATSLWTNSKISEQNPDYLRLKKSTEIVGTLLRDRVYQNFPIFIQTSSEIKTFQTDMNDIRTNILEELTLMDNIIPSESIYGLSNSFFQNKSQKNSLPMETEKKQRSSIKWIVDLVDRIDCALIERRYQDALQLIEKGKNANPNSVIEEKFLNQIQEEIEKKTFELIEILKRELTRFSSRSHELEDIIFIFARLNMIDDAQRIFLNSRTEKIKQKLKKIKVEGDTTLFISDALHILFTTIEDTTLEFRKFFKQVQITSCLISWINLEILKFSQIFKKNVLSASNDLEVVENCLNLIIWQSQKLNKLGISLEFLFTKALSPYISEFISELFKNNQNTLERIVSTETWKASKQTFKISDHEMTFYCTDSMKHLLFSTIQFIEKANSIKKFQIGNEEQELKKPILDHLSQLYEKFSQIILNDNQSLSILKDIQLSNEQLSPFFPSLENHFKKIFEQTFSLYSQKRSLDFIKKTLEWPNFSYDLSNDPSLPSQKFISLIKSFSGLKQFSQSLLQKDTSILLIENIFEQVGENLEKNEEFWKKVTFSLQGLNQFILDIKFFCHYYLLNSKRSNRDKISNFENNLVEKAMLSYAKQQSSTSVNIRPSDWFTPMIKSVPQITF